MPSNRKGQCEKPQKVRWQQIQTLTLFLVKPPLEGCGNWKLEMSTSTLTSIFDAHKEELAEKLKSFSLPRDTKEVETTVTDFLNNMFENDGTYRQGLTQSEDYILQSAIQLLHAQQSIANEIISMASGLNASPKTITEPKSNPYISIIGSGVGAVAGSFIGTWGAVCGAIAGTAIVIYLSTKSKKAKTIQEEASVVKTLNVNAFINIVKKICESIDELMETYRVQVKRIQHSYEQKEDITLLNSFNALTEQIANVIKVVNSNSDDIPSKVSTAVERLEESLENYDVRYENGKIVSNN